MPKQDTACLTTIELEADEEHLQRLGDVANLLQSGGELLGEVHASSDVVVVVGGEHGFDDLARDHICKITSCIGDNDSGSKYAWFLLPP